MVGKVLILLLVYTNVIKLWEEDYDLISYTDFQDLSQ
jgi:hypothetical protein